ncbi:hypothetical protein NQ314_012343 [Rhamnusium bicolor]|uniref:Uncharacterized protein n=1 Tax=Rhamnusium bicolor TaxID=1586634 RepID=A0AAV8XBS6_9CUCU|nr:hypothetical protein NQ314_012343 [Rhamnusium bicolor]
MTMYFVFYRSSQRVPSPTYQYNSEDANQEVEYNYPTHQQIEASTENYPSTQRDFEQQITKRLGLAKKPLVEQYLKEVTPTTKTVYNQRPGNYLRLNGRANKHQTEETQRSILKQSPFQYVLQSDLQQKAQAQPQIQYEIPEPKSAQSQQINELQPQTGDLSSYQNALLAHQKVLESENQEDISRSSIFVSHTYPKKPLRKIVNPKQSPVDEDVDYYTQLQQKQPQIYEAQQPAQVRYQARVPYTKPDTTYQASTEEPLIYQQEKYHPEYQTSPEASKYQSADPTYEYQTAAKSDEPTAVQYQRPTALRQGPKYLPEPKTFRYQPATVEEPEMKYQQVRIPTRQQEALIKYEDAIAKLQSQELDRTRQQKVRQQFQGEIQETPVRYRLQYAEESQQVPNQEESEAEYVRPEQPSRYRPAGRGAAIAYRQSLQNSNVRYYRNLGRPVVSYSNYQ